MKTSDMLIIYPCSNKNKCPDQIRAFVFINAAYLSLLTCTHTLQEYTLLFRHI